MIHIGAPNRFDQLASLPMSEIDTRGQGQNGKTMLYCLLNFLDVNVMKFSMT